MSKLSTIDITLEEGKELVGVKTNGNTITIIYSIESEYRPIGFSYCGNIEGEVEEEIEGLERK